MVYLLGTVTVCVLLCLGRARPAIHYGNAAYTYPKRGGNSGNAPYKETISAFNTAPPVTANISIIYAYGGDIEYLNLKPYKAGKNVFFATANQQAAAEYATTASVESIIAIVDGRMDGVEMITKYKFDPYGDKNVYPDMSKVTSDTDIVSLADATAQLYCSNDIVNGIQVDLEPLIDPYKENCLKFIGSLAQALRSEKHGCVNANYPEGRSVSIFTMAENLANVTNIWEILGPNGFVVFSGYDLYPIHEDDFQFNSVNVYHEKLERQIAAIKTVIGSNGRFTLAVPIGGSCHEYESYKPGVHCGPSCKAYTNNATMSDYATAFMSIFESDPLFRVNKGGQFIGLSFWVFTDEMSYPPMKGYNNDFFPPVPSSATLNVLKNKLNNLMS